MVPAFVVVCAAHDLLALSAETVAPRYHERLGVGMVAAAVPYQPLDFPSASRHFKIIVHVGVVHPRRRVMVGRFRSNESCTPVFFFGNFASVAEHAALPLNGTLRYSGYF